MGRRLRAARLSVGLNLEEAAARLEVAKSSLSRYEQGQGLVTVHHLRTMMDVYDQRFDDLMEMSRQARRKGWWKQYGISDSDFVALEAGASLISEYQLSFIPGLLQTADYAEALLRSGRRSRPADWIDNQLAVRLIRQERLTDEEHPLRLDAVIHEFALHYPVGGEHVMLAQLRHLALVTELPTVSLRVLPASAMAREGMYGGVIVLDFSSHSQPSILHLQHAVGHEHKGRGEQVREAKLRFEYLRSLALDDAQSLGLIERAADAL